MTKKYLVVDSRDVCSTYVTLYEGDHAMLKAVQDRDIDYIEVYEIVKKIKLESQPSIVLAGE